MKIVEYSKGSITEVENVFKVVESGAQGPQGPAGTIGTLDLLDNKSVVVAADLALTGDSAAAFANKNSTWQQLIDTVLSLFANNISDVNATALTDGGETALHSHAGGGGGCEWELAEARAMTGNTVELFDPAAYDKIRFEFADVVSDGEMWVGFSVDNGSTYPNTHFTAARNNASNSSTTAGFPKASVAYFRLDNNTGNTARTAVINLWDLQGAAGSRFEFWLNHHISGVTRTYDGSGRFQTNGVVDMIKISNKNNSQFSSGIIRMYGYVGDQV